MKKILLIALASLVSGCKTPSSTVDNKAGDKIKVTVVYSGDLAGANKGVKKGTSQDEYTIVMNISPKATMAEFISEFHKKTGLNSTFTMSGGAPPNRKSFETPYNHQISEQFVNADNEKKSLAEWHVNNNSTVVVEISGGGMVD